MKLYIAKKDIGLILGLVVLLLVVTTISWLLIGEAALVVSLVLATTVILVSLFETYRRLSEQLSTISRNDYRQVEALVSLYATISPSFPLPTTRDWAASPDMLKTIAETILTTKPELVVEAGSGTSTVITAYCLKRLGKGKVISLEHDPKYATISRNCLALHGLEEIAMIVDAPLKEIAIAGEQWLWYDTDCLKKIDQPIDLLTIDGPPGPLQRLSRYPALPLLFEHLRDNATVILDDGGRPDEQEIVDRWQKEFSPITCDFLELEKGAFVLKKLAASANA